MKIQCDVCDKDEASVFCVADEAALCAACDHRVHHANKLAGKHHRFSLLHPSPKQVPLCDICKEKRAFLFCQQDRAIVCKECDNSIHKANEHTQKHTRFLLTGVKLSSISAIYADSEASVSESTPPTAKGTTATATATAASESCEKSNLESMMNGANNFNGSISTSTTASSISEYLIEMLPGWHVEDFLDSSSPSPSHAFSKNVENDGLSFWDADLENSNMNYFQEERRGIWGPQIPPPLHPTAQNQSLELVFGSSNGLKEEQSKNIGNNYIKFSRKWNEDNSFAVPQIKKSSSKSIASKRSRTLW